jgi:hypothetical protein
MTTNKPIRLSRHAADQMVERGVTQDEVHRTVRRGQRVPAKQGRQGFRRNFSFSAVWAGKFYRTKQVVAIVAEGDGELVVITVYSFYF